MSDSIQTKLSDHSYQMTLSLNVLNHLGINLYSTIPAVLSEAVANSWDADATQVDINIDTDEEIITITDNGHGMDEEAVNKRYLHVGYRRRKDENQGATTPRFGRDVMGRKGIGKLSLFSIAKTVEVYTTDGEDPNAFRMDVDDIRAQIGGTKDVESEREDMGELENGSYSPEVLNEFPKDLDHGTKIVLRNLKKEHIYNTEDALRKRLARRFSVIGESHQFHVRVNNRPIEISDRDYFHKLQFLWTFDDGAEYGDDGKSYVDYCSNLAGNPNHLENETSNGYEVTGWIGAVRKPKQLEISHGDTKDDLNKITLLVRGKMAKENLLDDFNDSGFYTNYLVGEIRADYLDLNTKDDIATSDREDMVKDDKRYRELQELLTNRLHQIWEEWDELRDEQGTEEAKRISAVEEWYENIESEDTRRKAKQLFGKINKITTESEEEKRQLFKYSVLAFERLRYKENLSRLDNLDATNLDAIGDIFVELDDLEATLYYQIVKQRIEVIDELKDAVDNDEREEILQEHLFEHLWLLDPAWERATGSEHMEKRLTNTFKKEIDEEVLTGKQLRGRVDIKYRHTTGRHVIVELKRADRIVDSFELGRQATKYRKTLEKILRQKGKEDQPVEVVCVVGRDLSDWETETDRKETEDSLKERGVRVVKYQELLENAYEAYDSYLENREKVGEVSEIINRIDTEDLT